jgi:Mn-dependent DtxR family transcriptional regulator
MELTPRLQDIVNILRSKGSMSVKDLALEIKVSPKTAKGYVRELIRLGIVEEDENGNIKLKELNEVTKYEEVKKVLNIHESEIAYLKKELESLKEELAKLKKKGKV